MFIYDSLLEDLIKVKTFLGFYFLMINLESYKMGFKNILPIMPSVILFGLILGITGALGNVSFILVASTSFIIFAGSSQFIVIILIIANEPLLGIALAGIIINLRHLMYGAVLHDLVKSKGLKKVIVAYLLTDEAFLITELAYKKNKNQFDAGEYSVDNHLIGAGFTLWFLWNLSTDFGYFFAELVKNYFSFSTDFIVAATFLGYFVMNWSNSPENRVLMLVMSVIAFCLGFIFQSSTLIILILLTGISIGSISKYLNLKKPNSITEAVVE